jgi:hypothetical protein
VAIANRIVLWTACMFGIRFALSDGDFIPRQNEKFPLSILEHCSISDLWAAHVLHRKRKCLTVIVACLHAHCCDADTLIQKRYPFNLAMPVLICASTLTSLRYEPS